MPKVPLIHLSDEFNQETVDKINYMFSVGMSQEVRDTKLEWEVGEEGKMVVVVNIPKAVESDINVHILIGMIIGRIYSIVND